jgi:hypothetical protein
MMLQTMKLMSATTMKGDDDDRLMIIHIGLAFITISSLNIYYGSNVYGPVHAQS